jgi:hypothetical protein
MSRLIVHAYESLGSKKHASVLTSLVDKLEDLEEAQKKVLDVVRMPVPFQYFHLLNMMISVNVALWAYTMAMTESLLAPISFFFASLIYIGMLELAKELSDPFGRDEVDFPLHIWVRYFLENQLTLENADYLGGDDNIARMIREELPVQWNCEEIGRLIDYDPNLLDQQIAYDQTVSVPQSIQMEMNPAWGQYQPVPQDPNDAAPM